MMFSLPATNSSTGILAPLLLFALIQNVHAAGCCSQNYKDCNVGWCGTTKNSCENCGGNAFVFLEDGAASGSCLARWSGCKNDNSGCCDGLVCTEFSQWYSQCLPGEDDSTPIDVETPRPTTTPVAAPTQPPVATPRPSLRPTTNPTARPTAPPVAADPTQPPVAPTQPPVDSENCLTRWSECTNNVNGCCDGNVCTVKNQWYSQCLPGEDDSPIYIDTARPTASPISAPTDAPVEPVSTPTTPTTSPPLPEGILLTTDRSLNAWEVFLGLEELTHVNSQNPPNYAFVASGGAAGDGNLVVSEGQGYALLITGAVLASWDNHAGRINGASRAEVITAFEGYYNFWKEMCQNSNEGSGCQPGGGNMCVDDAGQQSVCLPDWRHSKYGGTNAAGPAPDGDEDAIVGIILALKALESDTNKPSWYNEARKWADASSTAFFEYNVDKSRGDHRLQKLGACWGGWEGNGNNPSYLSPGSYRVMRDYQSSFPAGERDGSYNAVPSDEWDKLVATSHEMILATQCTGDGAMVPNWVTVGTDSNGNIIHTNGSFSGSGTPQYEYGSEASRTTWRVAFDAALYPQRSSDWSPYLSPFQVRLDADFNNNGWSSNAFPPCRGPRTYQDITLFDSWLYNAFIYGPTLSALIASPPSIPNAQAMMDAAGEKLTDLPRGYFSRSWALLANLLLSGAMEDAGRTLNN